MARTRRAALNYLTGVAQIAVAIAVGLWATPLILRWLGEERYGAYRAAQDWLGYVGLLELGLGGALVALLAQAIRDTRRVSRVLAAGLRAYAAAGVVMAIAGVALVIAAPALVPVAAAERFDLRLGFAFGLAAILTLPLTAFRLLAEARQRSYFVNTLLAVQVICITLLSLGAACLGWGIAGQFLAAFIGTLPATALLTWHGLRSYRETLTCLRGERHEDGSLWRLNWPTLAHTLGGRVSLFTDNIVIAMLLSPRVVTPFFLTQRLVVLAQGQLQGIGNASWAGLIELHAHGQHDAFRQRLLELTKLVTILGVAVMAPLAAFSRSFVTLWVGEPQFAGETIAILAAANGVLLAVFSLWGWVFSGAGRIAALVPLQLIGAAINLAVSVTATVIIGTPGPLLGTFAMYVGYTGWKLPLLLRREFAVPLRPLVNAVARPLAFGIPYAVALMWMAQTITLSTWLHLAAAMTLAALLFLVIAWTMALNAAERFVWRARLAFLGGFPGRPWTRPALALRSHR